MCTYICTQYTHLHIHGYIHMLYTCVNTIHAHNIEHIPEPIYAYTYRHAIWIHIYTSCTIWLGGILVPGTRTELRPQQSEPLNYHGIPKSFCNWNIRNVL